MSTHVLLKPPFRFLHDCVLEVNRLTRLFDGLFDEQQLDYSFFQDKKSKAIFLQRLLDFLIDHSLPGTLADISVGKILAGLEPEKTNKLLVAMYETSRHRTNHPVHNINPAKSVTEDASNLIRANKLSCETPVNSITMLESVILTTRNLEVVHKTFIPESLNSLCRFEQEFREVISESERILSRLRQASTHATGMQANTVTHRSSER